MFKEKISGNRSQDAKTPDTIFSAEWSSKGPASSASTTPGPTASRPTTFEPTTIAPTTPGPTTPFPQMIDQVTDGLIKALAIKDNDIIIA